jgi:hypothetical protein
MRPSRGDAVGELLEAGVVCAVVLVALAVVVAIGLWYSSSQCYARHSGESVQWSFPGGCQIDIAGNLVPVDRARQSRLV